MLGFTDLESPYLGRPQGEKRWKEGVQITEQLYAMPTGKIKDERRGGYKVL